MKLANINIPLIGPSRPALLGTLAALIVAANSFGAPGTLLIGPLPGVPGVATSASGPGGFILAGGQMWVTDATQGLCGMKAPGGGGGLFTLQNCVLPTTSKAGVSAVLGQPAFDGVYAYLPDMSTASKGIWRYPFNGSTFGIGVPIATSLAGQRPGAITVGTDGNLYATMAGTSSYVRVNTPTAATQVVDNLGVTLSGSPARGIAFVGTQLWIADTDGELLVPNAVACGTKCKGQLDTQVSVPNPLSITWDGNNSFVYIGTSFGVFRHNRLTGQTDLYSKHTAANTLLSDVTAVGLDGAGNLYYIDDPTGSQTANASVYSVPFNSLADGQGFLGSPPVTQLVTESAAPPFANPAVLHFTGVTAPKGAVFMGTHVWVVDAAKGFCRVDPPSPPAAPSLTNCATLPLGFVPGSPAYDKAQQLVYLPDTSGTNGIVKLTFNPAATKTAVADTVGAATTVVANTVLVAAAAGATAPTALAVGPFDLKLYVAMAGTTEILRVTPPTGKATTPTVAFIGTMFEAGSVSLAFQGKNQDLYNVEIQDSSVIYGAALCQGNCTSLFVAVVMLLPTSVASDGTFVYFGDGTKVMIFDPIAETFANMADTGLLPNGGLTPFNLVTGLTTDGLGHVFAADAANVWQISSSGALPTITSMAPSMAAEGSTPTVTITGTNFLATSLVVSTCASGAIIPGSVTVVSPTTITATFSINPVGPLGACNVTVTNNLGVSPVSAGSSFTVLIGPPALTSITPASGFRGTTVPVIIAGANMGGGSIDPIAGVTISNTVVNAAGTQTTANFAISATATLGAQNLTVTTPSGPSNTLSFTIAAKPPVLTSITPLTAVANSTVAAVITGTDLFGATFTAANLPAANLPAGFTVSGVPVVTPTSINVTFLIASTVPAGPQSITVTTVGGISNAVSIKILPALTSIAPSSARAGDTTNPVTLTGTSLLGVTSITGANLQITVVATTATTVTATFASLASAPVGPVSVTVTDVNGTSNAVTFQLVGPIPTITSISPATGGTGASVPVTVTGTGLTLGTLNLPAGVTLVPGTLVNNSPTSFTTLTATLLLAGNAPLGNQLITVTTPGAGNTSNAVTFNVFALAPLLNTITPTTAAAGGILPVSVSLTGQGFTGTTSVNTPPGGGITVSSFTVVDSTHITANFSIAATATAVTPQQISVTNLNGTSNSLTFRIVPTLTSISPNSLPVGKSVTVTLTGTSLTGATSIGGTAGTTGITVTNLTVVSSTQITATFAIASNATQGVHNISVVTPGGTTGTVPFTVLPPPPTITSLNGPFKRASNQGVTLAGTNLAGATAFTAVQVFLNGNAVATTSWAVSGFQTSATQLRWNWTIPTAATAGNYTITVTTPSGTTTPFGFTVQ